MSEISRLGLAWVALPQRLAVFGAIWLGGAVALTGAHLLWPPSSRGPSTAAAIEQPARALVPPLPLGGDASDARIASGKAQMPMISTGSIQGADVLDNSEEKIGVVSDILVSPNSGAATAVVRVENRTGAAQKHIAVPFSELKFRSSGSKSWAVIDLNRNVIENSPNFKVTQ